MGILEMIKGLFGGVVDSAQGSVGEALGGITESIGLPDIQEHVTTLTEGASESLGSVAEQGQTAIEDITQKIGL